jgi:hypothetical protein
MTQVSTAAASLSARGIRCRRDPLGGVGRWVAEVNLTQYCVGGLDILAAAASADPIASLEAACS